MSFPTLPTPTGAPRCAGRSEGAPCCLPSRVPRAHPWASPALPCPALPCALALLRSKTCGAGPAAPFAPGALRVPGARRPVGRPQARPGRTSPALPQVLSAVFFSGLILHRPRQVARFAEPHV